MVIAAAAYCMCHSKFLVLEVDASAAAHQASRAIELAILACKKELVAVFHFLGALIFFSTAELTDANQSVAKHA
jgi:hypothetical protein